MDKRQFFIGIIFASILSALISVGGYIYFNPNPSATDKQNFDEIQSKNARFSSFLDETEYNVPEGINFIYAAEQVTKGVVHIKAEVERDMPRGMSPFEKYFREFHGGGGSQPRKGQSSGSGVIISPDGYIVTNNHVVENASKLEVVLHDNRSYTAKVIGADPNTDIALLKINEKDLSFVEFGNSDNAKIGEWVLAVGNPFNLTSTVTAGIVSAKARSINILNGQNRYGIESFIQTDAAVNPGNSGGALVNLSGKLIGVNTAIATPTGSYAGYSFAVPSILVKKVVNDLKEYGVVQRAVLGVNIADLNDPNLEGREFTTNSGIFVAGTIPGSAADEAGMKEADIIIKINEKDVSNVAELQEQIARFSPGEVVEVTFLRNGKKKTASVELKSLTNTTEVVKANTTQKLGGATFEDLTEDEMEALDISGGSKVVEIQDGKWKEIGIKEGFIVTAVDKVAIKNTEQLISTLQGVQGGVLIEGMYPDGTKEYYGMGWQ
ncbi:serine protease [Marivirga tractuosa]|uniref:Protease Do n=1 Tax=Marivirga tractuosa (strain ATCC 23168 / DSM 4126 / NBRC 15989 / NCIMB 1408 / VKM B-1430 / H-43) TaxID=643867 RepID=E4TN08_MARTH|nr:trypsin-like peptidase domain-containing protein [Marivirga tractuosa]ADR22422.1 protease Do [Marivirga tractuosa DSM 4126]BDD16907.1 serine protease [Marivirga tractuosa]